MTPLISAAQIERGVARLAEQLDDDYQDRSLTLLGVLTGSVVLTSDLMRRLSVPVQISLLHASSYRGKTTSPEALRVVHQNLEGLRGRDVLILDDIFDTGHTMQHLLEVVSEFEPASVKSAVLLWKSARNQTELVPDYYCFEIPDRFVVGYGLDYDGRYRQLPYIAVLDPEEL